MLEDEFAITRAATWKDERFNINQSYLTWMREFYKLFGKPAPDQIKKLIKRTVLLWAKDEHMLFTIVAKDFLEKKYECPKCKKYDDFIPTRHKQIEKMYRINDLVTCEQPRTISCRHCSFTFNPLRITFYQNMRIDLRTFHFYSFISDDGNIDYPVASIQKILNVSYGTAKKIKFSKTKDGYYTKPQANAQMKRSRNGQKNIGGVKLLVQKYDREVGIKKLTLTT